MTTHAAILEQVEKYEDGKFLPKRLEYRLTYMPSDKHDGPSWIASGIPPIYESEATAGVWTERAAFRAVWHWCKQLGLTLWISDGEHGRRLETNTGVVLASSPDEPAMWLSAVKYINGEKA